jgi:hypothetical protein
VSVTATADPVTALGGIPFLDDTFAARRLLIEVAAVRHVDAEHQGLTGGITDSEIMVWLEPARLPALLPDAPPMPAQPVSADQQQMIEATLAGLTRLIPEWVPLLHLPVEFSLLSPANGAVSASSRQWPQQVLLADEAFGTTVELREQVVHELCHQWLYLIEELWALEVPHPRAMTLPSGTADRSAAEVLGAAHVAAALTRMYRTDTSAPTRRLSQLAEYGAGCLNLLTDLEHDLTDAGRTVARRLEEAL